MKCRVQINIRGIVQGVGFRPFVYGLARKCNLTGYVLNNTRGVCIEVEGERSAIEQFTESIRTQPPPQAEIFEMDSRPTEPLGSVGFEIRESEDQEEKFVPISPELATCRDCIEELFNPSNRRFRYPFINCTNCGPRFTIVKDIPYDRKFTTMSVFPMCERCQAEYDDPTNRRFHAQPNACHVCGPRLFLLNHEGADVSTPDVISEVCTLLRGGRIVAIKGLGGYHLACDAYNQDAVARLRSRKYREDKPFALMVKDVETAAEICHVHPEEEGLLTGTKRPIVLLRKKADCPVADAVAPRQKYHGVMLPYTPVHHLLIAESGLVLVMTSGNISSEPIVFHDEEACRRLRGIADYYLINDREIHIRTDDSVVRVLGGRDVVLRRSRGYVPHPLLMEEPFEEQILACGAELKNTFCLTRGHHAILSHHIGDLENLETLSSFEGGIEHFKRIFNVEPTIVAHDLHPEYLSTKYALSFRDMETIGVQHHHAHVVSCMGDNGVGGKVIGVAFDGTGYGVDGKIWGGEFLLSDTRGFRRVAHLEYTPLPGGEKAIKEPWRLAASSLYRIWGDGMMDLDMDLIEDLDREKWKVIRRMLEKGINCPLTSSVGRLFDGISALLGVRREVHYEGQAAIELEMRADPGEDGVYEFGCREREGVTEIVLDPLLKGVVFDLLSGVGIDVISARFHNTVARIILSLCLRIREVTKLDRVALSGGVFQNAFLLNRTVALLEDGGFTVLTHHRVPPNDGGIALGQAIIASEQVKAGRR